MRAHILAIAVIAGIVIVSLAGGRVLTAHLLAARAAAPDPASAAAPSHK